MPRKKHPALPIVYQITNKVSGKIYIGVTIKPLAVRWYGHLLLARTGKGTVLHKAIRKYGEENFEIVQIASVLSSGGNSALMAAEVQLIAENNTFVPNGYNMTPGGEGVGHGFSRMGTTQSEEARAKMSAAWTPERKERFKARMSKPDVLENRKAAWTDEQRKLSRIRRGEVNRIIAAKPEVREKMRAAWTPERRAKNAERARKMFDTPEARANHLAAILASWTPERRARQSEMTRERLKRKLVGEK